MPKARDPTALLKHQMRINAAIKEATRLIEYWALKSEAHLEAGQRRKAKAALKRAQHWEFERRKLES